MVWSASKNYFDHLAQKRFNADVHENLDRIEKRMSRYENALRSGIGFFQGSTLVGLDDWHNFVEVLDIKKNYPGIQGIGYSIILRPDEVAPLEQKMRSEGFALFSLKPAGSREQYSSILYLEPLDKRNIQAIGYDMFSEPVRRFTMERARDTGLPSASGRVKLVQEIDSDVQAGILLYFPLYIKGAKIDTVEERRNSLIGFVYAPFRMNDLMNDIVLKESILNFKIYDTADISEKNLLYRSFKSSAYLSKYQSEETSIIDGRTWHIYFSSTPEFDAENDSRYPLFMTLGGLSVYLFLLFIILTLARSRQILQSQANELMKLSQAVEQNPNSIVITNPEGNIEYVNAAFVTITGYTKEEVYGKNARLLKSGKTPSIAYDDMYAMLMQGKNWYGEFINRRKDGSEYIESIKSSPIFRTDGTISHYMAINEDISDKKRAEERIHYLANFDTLTGLPNRAQLEERITYTINMAKRNNERFTMMFLDLDHFKDINDTLGHSIGDRVLIELAKRFESMLREIDTVSRLGGDEFIFLLPQTDIDGILPVVQRVLEIIDHPFKIDHSELNITASIGIAVYPVDGMDSETLSKNADIAMYRAKQEGRNKYCFYTETMQKRSARNLALSNALHHALTRHELHLVYQPQISLQDGRIIGAEALLRWNHPELGNISPVEFIPLAEDSGLILPIGEWVLRTAAAQVKSWLQNGLPPIIMAVNLSAVQFRQTNLPELITHILDEIGLPPEYLEIELTEAAAMHDPQRACTVMDNLYDRGIRMSIDDFGTGYSSLSYLKKFNVYKLKIDQSFIRDINTDPDDKAIVNTVISLAHRLGMIAIAEGVETIEQLEYLRAQGCDEVQGYYFSRPLGAEEFKIFLKENAAS